MTAPAPATVTYHIELLATKGQALWYVKLFIDYVLGSAVNPQEQR